MSTWKWRRTERRLVATFATALIVTIVVLSGATSSYAQGETDPAVTTEPAVTEPVATDDGVERVTTTEDKVRRVVLGLVAIAVVAGGLTVAYARHTSPRRRLAHLVAIRTERYAAAGGPAARDMRAVADAVSAGAAPPARVLRPPVAPAPSAAPAPRRAASAPAAAPQLRSAPERPDPRPNPRPNPRPRPSLVAVEDTDERLPRSQGGSR